MTTFYDYCCLLPLPSLKSLYFFSAEMLIQLGKMDDFFDFCGEITCEWNVVQDALDRTEQLNWVEIILLNEYELLCAGIRENICYELPYFIEFFTL